MKKLITFLFVTVCMLVMLPNISDGMGVSFDDPDFDDASRWSPFYNATISTELIRSEPNFIHFKFRVEGPNINVIEGKEGQLRLLMKVGESFPLFPVEGTPPGGVASVDLNADKGLMEIEALVHPVFIKSESMFSLSFYYDSSLANDPFVTEPANVCSSFVGLLPSWCPNLKMVPLMAQMSLPNPFLGAGTEIVIVPEMVITTGGAQFTIPDENHVIVQINITGNMIDLIEEGESPNYITVWKKYGSGSSTNFSKTVERTGNTLRITVPGLLKNEFSETHFKIEYEKPPQQPFEYNVEKMCTLMTELSPFCAAPLQLAPMQIKMKAPAIPAVE